MDKVLKRAAVARSDMTEVCRRITSMNAIGLWGRAVGCLHVLFVCFQAYLVRRSFPEDEFSGQEGWSVRWQTYLRSGRAGLSLTSGCKVEIANDQEPPVPGHLDTLGYGLGEFPCECLTL
jgi:hypothetical protein